MTVGHITQQLVFCLHNSIYEAFPCLLVLTTEQPPNNILKLQCGRYPHHRAKTICSSHQLIQEEITYVNYLQNANNLAWALNRVNMLTKAPPKKYTTKGTTGSSHLSQIFWEHENLSDSWVIHIISTLMYTNYTKFFWQKIWVKWESSLTTVWLNWDPPVTILATTTIWWLLTIKGPI